MGDRIQRILHGGGVSELASQTFGLLPICGSDNWKSSLISSAHINSSSAEGFSIFTTW
jgi:hypothetical protein